MRIVNVSGRVMLLVTGEPTTSRQLRLPLQRRSAEHLRTLRRFARPSPRR
jgi:hypothetical protein